MKPFIPSNRAFGIGVAAILALIALIITFLFDGAAPGLFISAGLFLLLALTFPAWLMPFNRLWGLLAIRLGKINNALILGLILYVFITPIALIMRLLARDPMHRSFDPKAESYLTPVFRQTNEETCKDLF